MRRLKMFSNNEWLNLIILVHIPMGALAFGMGWKAYTVEGAPHWGWKLPPAIVFSVFGAIGVVWALWLLHSQQQTE
jgi:hypothetical protein